MKILMALGLLFTVNSYASVSSCPSIEGEWSCQTKNGRSLYKKIERTAEGFYVETDGIGMTYKADKLTYRLPDLQDARDLLLTAYCEKNKFMIDFSVVILYEGTPVAKQSSHYEYALNKEGMSYTQKVKMKGIPMPTMRFQCTKI